MESKFWLLAANFLNKEKKHRRWIALVLCLAMIVALCTNWALAMQGMAMSHKKRVLDCDVEIHEHTRDCYDDDHNLICGYADYVVHTHNDDCYDEDGNLVCDLPEIKEHEHTSRCYDTEKVLVCTKEETKGHKHTDACYEMKRGDLVCDLEENDGHVHSDACYDEEGNLTCGKEEGEGAHKHDDKCYAWDKVLTCGKEEGEGAHKHGKDCYETVEYLTCGEHELHKHTSKCYDKHDNLICGKLELVEHVHDKDCFKEVDMTEEEVAALNESEEAAEADETETEQTEPAEEADKTEQPTDAAPAEETTDASPAEKTEAPATAEQPAEETEAAEIAEQPSEETEAPAEQPTEAGAEPAQQDEQTVFFSNDPTDSKNDAEQPAEEPAAVNMPAQQFSGKASGVSVNVTAPEGAFPEGTTMTVKAVKESEVKDAVSEAVNGEVKRVKAVDITFINAEGEEIQPAKEINVTLTADAVKEANKSEIVHVKDGEAEVITDTETNASGKSEEITFGADSFSTYAIVYTVDFTYDGYTYNMEGGTSIKLGELFDNLGITEKVLDGHYDPNDVASVEFTDESLVKVVKNKSTFWLHAEDDWTLHSQKPFTSEEILTVTMKNDKVIIIHVTDDQLTGTWDLKDNSNTQYLHVFADSSVTENEQERDAAFQLTFTYSLKPDVVRAIDKYNSNFTLLYDLSSYINSSPVIIENFNNGVIAIGARKLGTYSVKDGVVALNFTDPSYFDGKSVFTGYFELTAQSDESKLGETDEYTFAFPGTTDTIPIHYKKTVEEGSKSYYSEKDADGNYTIHYTANINVNSDLNSMTFNDTLGGLQTLDASSVKINGNAVTVSQSGNEFSFDVNAALGTDSVPKGNYKVTYDTKLTADQLKTMAGEKTTETNTASWKVNGTKDVPGGNTKIDFDKPKEPIPVTKQITDGASARQPGDTISYSITFGNEKTALAGFRIADYMTDVQTLQGTITMSYGGSTQEMPSSAIPEQDSNYSKNMTTLFDYTFPNETPGNGPVTVTYTTKLIDAETAKANGIYDVTDVVNTAKELRQNTEDTKKTTVTYEKEPTYTVTKMESSSKNSDGKWDPGTVINYTLTIGDSNTNMAGVNIKDVMTDLQVLQGDIKIKVGNAAEQNLTAYVSDALKWTDDGNYSTKDVELFNFNMPANAGNGPVVITYTTKVIDQAQATSSNIFGEKNINNTGSGGKQSAGTQGTGVFENFPINKTVTKGNVDVNQQSVQMNDTVHYTLTFGKAGMNLADAVIQDQMTDVQKLVGDVTITKPDGTKITMPIGTGQWSEDGVNWAFWDDGKYDANSKICLFKYKLPADIGVGPITVEYDAQIISEAEAKEAGLNGTKSAFNEFSNESNKAATEIHIEFPKEVTHNPQVRKEFDHWDVPNSKVFWNIIVEKDANSAYPLENVTVRENNWGGIEITESNVAGWYNKQISQMTGAFTLFDVVNAIITTDDGTVLTPGDDYKIDKEKASFTFPVLNERVHINLAFNSPINIVDGYHMKNTVRLENNNQQVSAEATYTNPQIELTKNGKYSESDRIVEWTVVLNPAKKPYTDSNPVQVWFEDHIPEGLTLVNYSDKTADNPSINVRYEGALWAGHNLNVSVDSNNNIVKTDVSYESNDVTHGLSGNKIIIKYYTKISDEKWNLITSSTSGTETFENNVSFTAGDNEHFNATGKVTVTSEDYIKKTDSTKTGDDGFVVDDAGKHSKNITYTVEINPNGYVLNANQPLTLTDYIDTNMDLDPSSVAISNAHKVGDHLVADNTVPTGLDVSYNDDSRLLSIRNIPDHTSLLLTYSCIARAQGQDTFTNTATLIGGGSHSSTDSKEHKIQTHDAGVTVDGIAVNLHKIDENNIHKDLSGAKFQIYECKLKIDDDLTHPEQYPQSYWNGLLEKMERIAAGTATEDEKKEVKQSFKITEYVPMFDSPQVTAESGYISWTGLNEHTLYAWKEIEAPVGYTANSDYHYFVGYQYLNVNTVNPSQTKPLPEDEQTNRKHAAWALDDAAQYANDIRVASIANLTTWTATNVEDKYTSISATKIWENDSDNLFQTRPIGGIKLQLVRINADGSRSNVGAPVSINADDHGNWPTYLWNKLPAKDSDGNELKYTVVEEKVENYTTSYSDNGEGQASGEIQVTNRMIPRSTDIHVKKVFDQGTDDTKPNEIKVSLKVITTDKAGQSSSPQNTSYYTMLSESNNWSWKVSGLPTTDKDGNVLTYTVVEDTAALEKQGFHYTVTYSDNGEGVLETTEEQPLTITNTKIQNGSLKITKRVTVNGDEVTDANKTAVDGTYYFTVKKSGETTPLSLVKSGETYAPATGGTGETIVTQIPIAIQYGVATTVEVTGLEPGKYVITEVQHTDNSIKPDKDSIEVEVESGKNGDDVATKGIAVITNNKEISTSVTLPHTGSIGTAPFTITGALLTAGAVLMLSAYTMKQKRTPARSRKGTEHDPKGSGPLR